MKVETVHNDIRYTLTNEGLQNGDRVYPIANGRVLDDGSWIFHKLDYSYHASGFPDDPHTIINLKHDSYKPYEVRTNKGYSPIECYFKIIKKEKQIETEVTDRFKTYKWEEIN